MLRGGVPLEGATIAPLIAPLRGGLATPGFDLRLRARRPAPSASRDNPADLAVLDGSGTVRGADLGLNLEMRPRLSLTCAPERC